MAAKTKKPELTEEEKEQEKIITSQQVLDKLLKEEKAFHYNFEDSVTYKVSSGSLVLDSFMNGGMGPGLHRFTGLNEGGKEQPISEPVLTPSGWIKIGDLKIGDTIVDSSGEEQIILGVFPQGEKDVYKVSFDDGSEVKCGIEHLWETSSFAERHNKKGPFRSVKDLSYIIKSLKYGANLNHSVRLVKPINLKERNLPIPPYLLGALIGDGGMTQSIMLSNIDPEVWSSVERDLLITEKYQGFQIKDSDECTKRISFPDQIGNPIISDLKSVGLYGLRSHEKFIPDVYKFSSINQRLELLRGLVDTDGYVNDRKSDIHFYTTSEKLANDVLDIVRSLGGLARKRRRKTSYINKNNERKICKDCFTISFYLQDGIIPCTIKRKVEALSNRKINFCHFIKNVELVGREKCVCIKVSSPDSLYVTRDYVLTHNTSAGLAFMYFFLQRKNAKGFYIKAEGRLSENLVKRCGIKFVYKAEDWVDGTCFVFESNIYETVVDAMRKLVQFNCEKKNYFFMLDSVDGLISKGDLEKTFEESNKVAGGAVIAANFMKRMSIALAKRGHMAIFISQVRADIKIDTYSKEPIRQTTATGGNALLHFANWILEFNPRFKDDFIMKNPEIKNIDPIKNPIIGHFAKVTVKKSPNETTNLTILYPIKYGKADGPSVWSEKEVVDLLLSWSLIERGKSGWMTCSEDLISMLAENDLPEIPKIQGMDNLFKFLEANPAIIEFLTAYFKESISNEV